MKMLLRIAWLNVWRNKRRTAILMCALVAGLTGVLFCKGFMNGWMDDMVMNAIRGIGGHIKLHAAGYRQNPVVEHSLVPQAAVREYLASNVLVAAWTERVTVQGMVSNPRHSAAVRIVGVDPGTEAAVSTIPSRMVEGEFLAGGEGGRVILGRALLKKLGTGMKKKVVLMSQQTTGDIGSGAFRIAGVYDTGNEELDRHTVYVLRSDAQAMLQMGDRVTEVAVLLRDLSISSAVGESLQTLVGDGKVEVLSWRELLPFVGEMLDLSGKYMVPFLGIFYIAMAFGVLNTLLIAVGERTYETGVMRAVGMTRMQVVGVVVAEAVFVACVAVLIGLAVGCGLTAWFGRVGIDMGQFSEGMSFMGMSRVIYPELHVVDSLTIALAGAIATVVSAVLPAIRAARTQPVRAMRKMT
jgi:putative ABC transport system permease protein